MTLGDGGLETDVETSISTWLSWDRNWTKADLFASLLSSLDRQRDSPLKHRIAPRRVVGKGHLDRLVRSERFDLHGEEPIQPIALVPVVTGVRIVMHSGCVVDAKPGMRKTSCIAFTIKGKPIADRFAHDDCTRPGRLFHEGYRCDCGGNGLTLVDWRTGVARGA